MARGNVLGSGGGGGVKDVRKMSKYCNFDSFSDFTTIEHGEKTIVALDLSDQGYTYIMTLCIENGRVEEVNRNSKALLVQMSGKMLRVMQKAGVPSRLVNAVIII